MQTTTLISALLATLLLVSTDAKHLKLHHHTKIHHKKNKNHHQKNQLHHKFRETRLVADYDNCNDRDGRLVLCATQGFECRVNPDQPEIDNQPPNDPICMPVEEGSDASTGLDPWSVCVIGQDTCLYKFECICDDYANQKCWCRPPDAVRMERDTSDDQPACGTEGCFDDQYCKYTRYTSDSQDLIKVCATKPYYYSDAEVNSTEESTDGQ